MGRPLEYLSSSERRECIKYLDEIGFFQLKGSVETLAKAVNKSRYTLYADLREVRKG
ncbi:helix-turn-helix domain-containing protein [Synergistes jonesii]|nr:helix-turn-helix domain-containing protein [Synergistes jonesii]